LRILERVLLAAVLLLGLGLRLHDIEGDSLWLDELFSLLQSSGLPAAGPGPPPNTLRGPLPNLFDVEMSYPLPSVWRELRTDNHPPLFFVLLRLWREAFGSSAAAVRGLSVLASMFGLLFLFDAVRHQDGVLSALWATLLCALAGPQVYYAREVRSYALMAALVLGAAAAASRLSALGPGRLRAFALGAAAFFACLAHYHAVGFLSGLFAWITLARCDPRARRQAILACVLAGASFLAVWGPMLWQQRQAFGQNNAWNADDPNDAENAWTRLLPTPVQAVFTTGPMRAARPAWLGLSWIALALVAWRRPAARLWAATGLGAVGLVFALDALWGSAQLEFTRFTLPATAAIVALAASARLGDGLRRHVVPAVLALGLAWVVPHVYDPHRAPWREWGRRFEALDPGPDVVAYVGDARNWYGVRLLMMSYAWTPERRLIELRPPLDAATRAVLGPRFFVVSKGAAPPDLPGYAFERRMGPPWTPMVDEARAR
jgi:hypothetical protein